MHDLTLVNHCWGYSRLLTLQLSGFVLFPPKCRVLYRLCYTPEDTETVRVLEWFRSRMPATVTIAPHPMEKRRLVRREIGRNECAKTSHAPIVAFVDTDYIYAGDLDKFLDKWTPDIKLAHPSHVHATTHPRGMEMIQTVEPGKIPEINLAADFPIVQRISVAIGGLQFFSGDWVREHGYCGDEVGGRRLGPAARWCRTKGDKKVRYKVGEDRKIKGPLFYRVRHPIRSEGAAEDVRL